MINMIDMNNKMIYISNLLKNKINCNAKKIFRKLKTKTKKYIFNSANNIISLCKKGEKNGRSIYVYKNKIVTKWYFFFLLILKWGRENCFFDFFSLLSSEDKR